MRDFGAKRHHPITETVYFLSVILVTFFAMHPIVTLISFVGLLSFLAFLRAPRGLWREILFALSFGALVCVFNPLFSQKGATALFYIGTLKITLEALLYGGLLGAVLVLAIFWFKLLSGSLDSGRVRALFGKRAPRAALAFSMSLSLIPQMRRKYGELLRGLKVSGEYIDRDFLSRVRTHLKAFSMLITWSLESGITRADSMKAKGYGTHEQSFYTEYHFGVGEVLRLALILVLDTAIAVCLALGGEFRFYPTVSSDQFDKFIYIGGALFLLLCLLPLFENLFRSARAQKILKKGKQNKGV